jgi:hypothetical protein
MGRVSLSVVVAVAVAMCWPARADVTILAEQYTISGQTYGTPPGVGVDGSYSDSGTAPLSDGIHTSPSLYADSSAGECFVSASAIAEDSSVTYGWPPGESAQATARGSWTITGASSAVLRMNVQELWVLDWAAVDLSDLTTSQDVYSNAGESGRWNTKGLATSEQTFALNPDDTYSMTAYIEASSSWDGLWHGSIQWVPCVPVPASLLLGVVGTGLFGCLRRRRTL